MTRADRRPHVAMIVANDITIDSRVKKTAATLASLGYAVTLVGVSKGAREEGRLGDCRLIRVADQAIFRNAAASDRSLRRPRSWFGYRSRSDYVLARHRIRLRERSLQADIGRDRTAGPRRATRRLERAYWSLRRRVTDRRAAIGTDAGRTSSGGYLASAAALQAQLDDWEFTVGVELDRLEPDVIHVHDVHLLGIAERAVARARGAGRRVHLVYDAHEYVRGETHLDAGVLARFTEIERAGIAAADAVTTVSPLIAEWLARDHGVDRVDVVLNAPSLSWPRASEHSVRAAAGVLPETPLVVYAGGQSDARGVPELIDAIGMLPDVHCVLVASPTNRYVYVQRERAVQLGWGERVHIAPYVAPEHVPSYLSTADVGVIPLRHTPNHDAALPNKMFEYLHAGLPIVTSDLPLAAAFVTEHELGKVFAAGDPQPLADALRSVIDDLATYACAATDELARAHSWEAQESTIADVYARLGLGARPSPRSPAGADHPHTVAPSNATLLIGPANMAGQANSWAEALRRHTDVDATSMTLERAGGLYFATDRTIPRASWTSRTWQVQQLLELPNTFTHVLLEAGMGVLGDLNGGRLAGDTPFLVARGIRPAAVFHGSDIRDPRRHAASHPFSPFRDPFDDLTARLQQRVDETRRHLDEFPGPVFVTTLDLFDDLPDAIWLPTCLDPDVWRADAPPSFAGVPRVLHAPTRTQLKGSEQVDPLLHQLESEGLITYDRVHGVPHHEMPARVAAADIVLDQFVIGHYCHFSIEAMATGRVVIANVPDHVRDRLDTPIPIVQADPSTLESVLRSVLADPTAALELASAGPEFVQRTHDGRLSAQQLERWIDGTDLEPIPSAPDDTQEDTGERPRPIDDN
ncbi:MAG: glycosyltransferase [Ilumatobacter sp.]|uniref:glycosyltransferase n=1 Tax=Ilumatobacter sp. TaxID=1967498 RepID=UPI002605BC97|nr:glycosyltransferase [Ilumatobacter sp.]MDJ0768351.1 glycosyltransferase [Ilumatobacter sp.]